MSRSQPRTYTHPNGPSRNGHGRDRVRYHISSRHNDGACEQRGTSSRTTRSPRQQTGEPYGYTYHDNSDGHDEPYYGHQQNDVRREYQQYVEAPRQWTTQNPDIHRVINDPALNAVPTPSRQQDHHHPSPNAQNYSSTTRVSLPSHSSTTHPDCQTYSQNPYSSQSTSEHLTLANLEAHSQRSRPTSYMMERCMREDQRTGPFDAVGYIRRDGGVYREYEGYEAYDARSDGSP